jgi:apolipoprotein N-acyltransferase
VADGAERSAAAWIGFAFGAGLFAVGASWVFIALNTFGGMPLPLAAIGTAGFCAFLALYPAGVGWVATRWTPPRSWQRALAAAALWPLAEWARSIVFTGFPWLSLGYATLPGAHPPALAGYAPLGGVFLVSLAMALVAAALALAIDALAAAARRRAAAFVGIALAICTGGATLGRLEWTSEAGAPLAVSLLQGNVAQELKFDPDFGAKTFDLYIELVASSRGRLVVLPESAFPLFAHEVPDAVLLRIIGSVVPRSGDAIIGLFTSEPPLEPGGTPRYYNSVVTVGTAQPQLYRKRHLVPFGETIPWSRSRAGSSERSWQSRSRARRVATPINLRSSSPASAWPSISATRTRSARKSGGRRARRRSSSTSPTMRGTGARSPRCSTTRSRRCARSRPGVRCSARPTPASRPRSDTMAGD